MRGQPLNPCVNRHGGAAALVLSGLLLLLAAPVALAHPPPPETGGMVFILSGEGADQSLIRDGLSSAQPGEMLVTTGGGTDLGLWMSEELTSPLEITGTTAILNLYAMPVTIVFGAGMYIDVTVMVDGEEMVSGTSETIILNEPLMTNIPWTSDEFDIVAAPGQRIEVNAVAHIDGIGGAQVQWGETDAPAEFALMFWTLNHTAAAETSTERADLSVEFDTPWNCSDIDLVSLKVHGPVDDHDEPWPETAAPGEMAVEGDACAWAGDVTGLSGTLLYRWHVEMSDGEQFNLTGDVEVAGSVAGMVMAPRLSLWGGFLGSLLALIPMLALTVRETDTKSGFSDRFAAAFESDSGTRTSFVVWLVIGISTGLLAGPVIAVLVTGVLAVLFWTLDAPEEQLA